ncbi:MAG TPA: hypothetical protein EYH55_05315 [Methanothermococcus okinawensis]|uniref:DUF4870 domain-containing protein n=1 Tax=Methanothermococcus okinawensis TaxID=155863 RepID=A0A832ZZA8_9EURY|nr:hypothetical protein [Methanothermococcus okinawensis]
MSKTKLGLEENIEGVLCYLLGEITGILFLLLERENDFVKFHAMQSIITFLSLKIITVILINIPYIGSPIALLISLVGTVLWILGMYNAYLGKRYKFPIFGDIAEELLRKFNI